MKKKLNDEIQKWGDKYYIALPYHKYPVTWLGKYIEMMNWENVSKNKVSEKYLRFFIDHIQFDKFPKGKKLSELFIKDFHEKLNMNWISERQKLSYNFIIEHKDKLNMDLIMQNKKISNEIKNEIKKYLNDIK